METHVVIMAGGVGSRLWPVSTPAEPKQFIDLLGCGRTMIQMTVDRFLPLCDISNFWVVTSEAYVDIVKEQIPLMPADHILAEPQARNTAPCIAYACWKIRSVCAEANIVVTPADALVLKVDVFCSLIRKALAFTASGERIATVGITPFRPETGYGYICAERKEYGEVVKVVKFEEKPDLATAKRYLESGNYFWNAGIFVWTAATIESQIRRHAPQIASVMDGIAASFGTESEQEVLRTLFPTCPKISIDYAVIEKSDVISVIAGDLGWSDLGSYSSVKSHIGAFAKSGGISSTDEETGCSTVGKNVTLVDCEGCIVHSASSDKVVVKGLKDYIVAVNGGDVLVYPLEDEQHVKDYV
ncbi:MAG: mannose-1-phosphate guanylyltransferase [Candidatus Cryptobacteroides sp.]